MTDSFNESSPTIEACIHLFAPTQIGFICLSLLSFVFEVQKKLALLSAYHSLIIEKKLTQEQDGSFLAVALQSIERQTMMEIAMMFDRAHFREADNCSFKLLKEKIGTPECTGYISKQQLDGFVGRIDALYEKCAKTLPKDIRNKQMAHHDLSKIQEFHESQVNMGDMIDLANESANLIAEIGTIFCGGGLGEVSFPPFSDIESYYKKDILCTIGILDD